MAVHHQSKGASERVRLAPATATNRYLIFTGQ
jgi:hypothetical protein